VRFRREAPLAIHWGFAGVLYGAWRLLQAIALVFCAGTATVMFGALLTRVADPYKLDDWISFGLHRTGDLFGGVRNSGHRCKEWR